ncbi:hypothetical protein [Marininema mesophilum]|uniref:hypothetical protein n=1 Tax=Marininema mesophilum TaxID=1048340 RepID=UPI0011600683|nr:hypothetical protein [Marininema mesophilum]
MQKESDLAATSLLVGMFALVLFLARSATGGFDITAKADRFLSTKSLEKAIKEAGPQKNKVTVSSAVTQIDGLMEKDMYTKLNGVDAAFTKSTNLPLRERDSRYVSDRKAWQAVSSDPDVVIISERDIGGSEEKIKLGSRVKVAPGVKKKVIGIAKYRTENYEYYTASGIWIQKKDKQGLSEKRS